PRRCCLARMNIPEFDLVRLINTIFRPQPGERIAVFIDLPNLQDLRGWKFLDNQELTTQRIAYEVFYQGLLNHKIQLPFASVGFFAYEPTGGSNLDLPETVLTPAGRTLTLLKDVLTHLAIVPYLSTYAATSPLTALPTKLALRTA